jgi:hypothetical protein
VPTVPNIRPRRHQCYPKISTSDRAGKALEIEILPMFLARADEVIE